MLTILSAIVFLQSIYPLSIPMPGFLQWGRMLRYATPAFTLLVVNALCNFFFEKAEPIHSFGAMMSNFSGWEVFLRILATGVSIYYIVNIVLKPRVEAKSSHVPTYVIGYCTALGLVMIYYMCVSMCYSVTLVAIYLILLTLLNVFLVFRTLQEIAIHLPSPSIQFESSGEAEAMLKDKEKEAKKEEDFNIENLFRFQRLQCWMQANKVMWTDITFGRDRLCKEIGYNRHMLLETVRSQGFNNVHEYIVSYRLNELKRMIRVGELKALADTSEVGFGTVVTARSCFKKAEGITLDEYFQKYVHPTETI
ncbi:MAG: hypothetical protein HUK03_09605 [Bacteroidaceae bacterium]|nr:hypothetical protein [Bacteroidaceae bacterium]